MKKQLLIYFNRAEQWVDFAEDDGEGAIGSGWQQTDMGEEECEAWIQDHLAHGYERFSPNAPRY